MTKQFPNTESMRTTLDVACINYEISPDEKFITVKCKTIKEGYELGYNVGRERHTRLNNQ